MKIVRDILEVKGHQVWCIEPAATVLDALRLMAEKEIGALVVRERDKIVGIVSERDYARKVILSGRSSPTTAVKEIMSSPVAYTHPGQTIEECMALMTEKRMRHLPVLDAEKLVGLISIGDLVKSIIDDQKFIIEQLERYISS
jgi:CBS domain-containing protein